MSVLEEKIRKNRERYDVHEPVDGHIERFASKLDEAFHQEERSRFSWNYALRYAAAVILIAGVSTILLVQILGGSSELQADPVNQELAQVMDHYNRLADQKLEQINTCVKTDEEAVKVDQIARAGIQKLEQDAHVLQQELQKDNTNKRILDALVNNYRTRIRLLDNILTRICEL
ncbi:MAG TPA: hypothetical protein VK994_08405 [Bacteroidales bacterium]|nr:hypothetical protein [Bacteroidales bacterium]